MARRTIEIPRLRSDIISLRVLVRPMGNRELGGGGVVEVRGKREGGTRARGRGLGLVFDRRNRWETGDG